MHKWLSARSSLFQRTLSKQRAFDADPKAIQQIKFTGNLDQNGESILDFSHKTVRALQIHFALIN